MTSQVPTIYDWAGGRPAFERWLDRFYDLVEEDDLLVPLFGAKVIDQHRRDVVTWWCEVMGGPATYTNDLGGYEHMLSKHRGLHIAGEQRLRFVTLLSRAADDADLPDDPEFRAAVMGYAEWGTRLAMHNSSDADDIVEHAPVPRWGWGVAPPYEPQTSRHGQPAGNSWHVFGGLLDLGAGEICTVGRDSVQPGPHRRTALKLLKRAPRPQVRLLNQVLGLLSRAQHPRAMSQQLTPPSATDESLADCHRLRPNWWREPSDALASHI